MQKDDKCYNVNSTLHSTSFANTDNINSN